MSGILFETHYNLCIVVIQTTVFIDTELKCPMCGHVAPDIDSLQLHCNDCIE